MPFKKCGAVFLSISLFKEHDFKSHVETFEIEIDDNTPTVPRKQLHCALEESPQCHFQCETNQELNKHIEDKHRGKKELQCKVCEIYFRSIDDLSKHMTMTHKKKEDPKIKCTQCRNEFKSNKELNSHIRYTHKT